MSDLTEDSYNLVDKFVNILEDVRTDSSEVKRDARNCAVLCIEEKLKVCTVGDRQHFIDMKEFINSKM